MKKVLLLTFLLIVAAVFMLSLKNQALLQTCEEFLLINKQLLESLEERQVVIEYVRIDPTLYHSNSQELKITNQLGYPIASPKDLDESELYLVKHDNSLWDNYISRWFSRESFWIQHQRPVTIFETFLNAINNLSTFYGFDCSQVSDKQIVAMLSIEELVGAELVSAGLNTRYLVYEDIEALIAIQKRYSKDFAIEEKSYRGLLLFKSSKELVRLVVFHEDEAKLTRSLEHSLALISKSET